MIAKVVPSRFAEFLAVAWWRVLAALIARYELILAPDGSPYLSRWHFPKWLAKRYGAAFLFLHYFHQSDPDRGWHCHPWAWMSSRILSGAYWQITPKPDPALAGVLTNRYETFSAGDRNTLAGSEYHAVILLRRPVWTLFAAGMKHGRSWGFMDRYGRTWPANGEGVQ